MDKYRSRHGFTLVELLIVVAILGLLAVLAIPNFTSARRDSKTTDCINNLRMIHAAKEQYAMANYMGIGGTVSSSEIDAYITGGMSAMQCKQGGTYTIGAIGTFPVCTAYDATEHNAVYPPSSS